MNIGDRRAFTSIIDMQISLWRQCLLYKLTDFLTNPESPVRVFWRNFLNIGWILLTWEICKLDSGGHVEYAN